LRSVDDPDPDRLMARLGLGGLGRRGLLLGLLLRARLVELLGGRLRLGVGVPVRIARGPRVVVAVIRRLVGHVALLSWADAVTVRPPRPVTQGARHGALRGYTRALEQHVLTSALRPRSPRRSGSPARG